jgi:hypothetical protein
LDEEGAVSAAQQLGFGFEQIAEEQRTAHLPDTMEAAIPYYRAMLERHHAAMLVGAEKTAMAIRHEAEDLAVKLNSGEMLGILGGIDAPGCVLERETAAPVGTIPLWGQKGDFTITVGDMPVRIKMDGIMGICGRISIWPGFGAYAVEPDKPFFSETGYRSFLSVRADMVPGLTPDAFAKLAIESYIAGECKGRLRAVKPEYRGR